MPVTWGAPIPGRSLGCLFTKQTVQGTAVTPATATGARFRVTSEGGVVAVWALGTKSPILMKPGETQVSWELTLPNVQNSDLITYISRNAGGELDWLTLGFGVKFDGTGTPTQWAWQVQDCKIARARLRLSAKGALEATLSGIGGLITELTSFTPANETADYPFWGHEATLLRAGSAYEVIEWTEEVDHNVLVEWVFGTTAAPTTFPRGWRYQTEGNEMISGSFTVRQKSGINLQAGTVVTFGDGATTGGSATRLLLTSRQSGGNTLSFTYTGMIFPDEAFEGGPDGAAFTVPYLATSRVLA